MFRLIKTYYDGLKAKQEKPGWAIGLISLGAAYVIAYAILLAADFAVCRDLAFFNRISPLAFAINVVIVCSVFNMIYGLTGRWVLSATLLTFTSTFLIVIHIIKMQQLDTPLIPADLYLIPQFVELAPKLKGAISATVFSLGASLVIAGPAVWIAGKFRCLSASRRYRAVAGAGSLIVLAALVTIATVAKDKDSIARIVPWYAWNQKDNYQKDGFFLATVANLSVFIRPVPEPKDYTQATVERVYRKVLAEQPAADAATPEQSAPANVILILEEAFWDLDRLGAKFNADPLPFFHSMQKLCLSGWMQVPTYGGYTAKTEFEVLTGNAMANIPEIANPYAGYIPLSDKIPSLPHMMKAQNYWTCAVHSYKKAFWERSKAYPILGFDDFYDQADLKRQLTTGPWVSDEMLIDKVIETSRKKSPYFMFVITMGTHGPYHYQQLLDEKLDLVTSLTTRTHNDVKTYANAASRLDSALKRLIDHFSQEKKKTLIVMFGDHLPMLGEGMSAYKEVGYIKPGEEKSLRMFETPIVAWANYRLPRAEAPRKAHYLIPFILRLAGAHLDPYARFIDAMAWKTAHTDKEGADDLKKDFELIEYDILFGKQYVLALDRPAGGTPSPVAPPAAPAELLDLPTLEKLAAANAATSDSTALRIKTYGPAYAAVGTSFNTQSDGGSAFWFTAENTTPLTAVMLNDTELPTTFGNDGKFITARVKAEAIAKPGTYDLVLFDKIGRRVSNEVTFKVIPKVTPAPTPGPMKPAEPLVPPPVINWGPRETEEGVGFNVHDGVSAMWFQVERQPGDVTVLFNGKPVQTFASVGIEVSANIPQACYEKPGDYAVVILDNKTGKKTEPLTFTVRTHQAAKALREKEAAEKAAKDAAKK